MAARPVLRYPHPALKHAALPSRAQDVERVTRDLLDTMRAHTGCVGIAAPQISEPVRIVAVDVTGHPRAQSGHGLLVLVDPVVTGATGAEVAREGCLSIPDLTANVRRATEVTVEARGASGDHVRIESRGFEARCLLHEIDHLDGILFLDRVDSLRRDVFRRKRS
ncbi:MAG: peptide deformylase [Solirubrobacterales bacterium]